MKREVLKLEYRYYIYMLTRINAHSQTRLRCEHTRLQSIAGLLGAGETPTVGNRHQASICETWNSISGWFICSGWMLAVIPTANCIFVRMCSQNMRFSGNLFESCDFKCGCWCPNKLLFWGQMVRANRYFVVTYRRECVCPDQDKTYLLNLNSG